MSTAPKEIMFSHLIAFYHYPFFFLFAVFYYNNIVVRQLSYIGKNDIIAPLLIFRPDISKELNVIKNSK